MYEYFLYNVTAYVKPSHTSGPEL